MTLPTDLTPLVSVDGRFSVFFHTSADMGELRDESVDCIVTSPPYGLGIDYSNEWEGDEPVTANVTPGQVEAPVLSMADYEAYIDRMKPIWRECYRVMAPGAYACLNFGSIHAKAEYFGHSFMFPQADDVCHFWRKTMGAEHRWKYVWIAARNNARADGSNAPVMGSYPMPLEGQMLRQTEEIAILRKPGPPVTGERLERRRRSILTLEEWRESFAQVWEFQGAQKEEDHGIKHPANFPVELPLRLLRAYSCLGDMVVDPFLGSGTTMLAARQLGRRCVGYEIESRFRDMIARKTGIMGAPIGRPAKLAEFDEPSLERFADREPAQ